MDKTAKVELSGENEKISERCCPCGPPKTLSELLHILQGDMYRYKGARGLRDFARVYFRQIGFRVTLWIRVAGYLRSRLAVRPLYWLVLMQVWRCSTKYGISIPHDTVIGPGLYIGHYGGVVVHGRAKIGRNCNLSQGVTIGKLSRGPRKGFPIIGDGVYIGPGAKVLGGIKVGSDVVIGANAVVVKDVRDGCVVGGVPAKELSQNGAEGYVTWKYDEKAVGNS